MPTAESKVGRGSLPNFDEESSTSSKGGNVQEDRLLKEEATILPRAIASSRVTQEPPTDVEDISLNASVESSANQPMSITRVEVRKGNKRHSSKASLYPL